MQNLYKIIDVSMTDKNEEAYRMARKTKDEMTPKQRAAAIANGEEVDRMPCNPNVANGVARVYGCKISEFNTSAKTLA